MTTFKPQPTDALVLIDIQNDFMPGGALAVPDGNLILPEVERLSAMFDNIILTQDFHPAGHKSFASSHEGKNPFDVIDMPYGAQVLWPDHCVQGTSGADFHLPKWIIDKAEAIIQKGMRPEVDSYSGFIENDRITGTGLFNTLTSKGYKRIFCAGLALDYCVAFTALDSVKAGFETVVAQNACRGIDPKGTADQLTAMQEAGISIKMPI